MKRIALDARFWRKSTGGLSRYAQQLLINLLELDKDNEYTAIITSEDDREFDLTRANLRKLVVDIPHYSLAEQRQLNKILNDQQFDLVHFTNFNHPIFYRRPFVVTVHDLIQKLFPTGAQKKSRLKRYFYSKVVRDCRRARAIIVPSQSTKNDLVRIIKLPIDKIVVTNEGASEVFRPHNKREIINIKERYNLPEQYLLFVSRWTAYKGLNNLLEAYEKIAEKMPEVGLVICGRSDPNSPEVEERVFLMKKKFPKIITVGFVSDEDLAAIYSAASVFVHPSFYEGFGIMILEAFAAETPVVTSNISSLPEVAGDAAILVNPYNVYQIANACVSVLNNPQRAKLMVEKGRERLKHYSWRKMAAQTLAIYKDQLNSR